jgi:hypothetical protein
MKHWLCCHTPRIPLHRSPCHGLTRESLFEILARSETRFLDPKFSRDSRETRESKLVARLASLESHRQKFCSETCEKWVSLWNFAVRIASYESRRKKFFSKARFLRFSQSNFEEDASHANRNFVARLARIITNFNSRVLREFWVQHLFLAVNYDFPCLRVSQLARLANCETRKLWNSQASQYIAFFPSCETCEICETCETC